MNDNNQFSLENLNFPETLYHYRNSENIKKYNIFKTRVLWRSSPAVFNDPFDCKIQIRFEQFTNKQFKKYVRDNYERAYNYLPKKKRERMIQYIIENRGEYISNLKKRYQANLNLYIGITCFSFSNKNVQLWSYYGGNHDGICIGFDAGELNQLKYYGLGGTVQYIDTMPSVPPALSQQENHTITKMFLLYKQSKWKHEEEVRLFKTFQTEYDINDTRRGIILEPKAFKEVIFGCKINRELKFDLTKIIREEFSHVKLFEAKTDTNSFDMIISPII